MSIYRKLKDYIQETEYSITLIFGDLMSKDCCFAFKDENEKWQEWFGVGINYHQMDYLLDYYVVGINSKFKIENDKIIPFLYITLYKEKPDND